MKENNYETISQKYYNCVVTPSYQFKIIYAERLNGETVEFMHYHPYFEIYYCMSGQLKSRIDNKIHTLYPGDLLFLAPNVKHHTIYEPNDEKEYFAIIFDIMPYGNEQFYSIEHKVLMEELLRILTQINTSTYLITRNHFNAYYALDTIQKEMREKKIGFSTIVNSSYHEFFIHAMRTIDSTPSSFKEPAENLNLGLEASKFIHNNYFCQINLQSVANYLNISPRQVNRVFFGMFGTTFNKALTLLRLNYAKKFLCSTNYSIEKISELVGFKSSRILYKLFKEHENTTVSEYRKSYKK